MPQCPKCNEDFESEKSMRCHYAAKNEEPLNNKECDECGKEFYSSYDKKYCNDCFSMEGEKNPNYQGKLKESECVECGGQIKYYKSNKKGLYCNSCQEGIPWQSIDMSELIPPHEGNTKVVCCYFCGEEVEKNLSSIRERNFCNEECKNKWLSNYYQGSNHPNWQNNYNSEYTKNWWKNRKKALERDNHNCQKCGISEVEVRGSLDVHHKKPLRTFDNIEKAHKLDNLQCLCRQCHHEVEKELRQKY